VWRYADSMTAAIEQALALWLARERRKAAKARADPLSRHLAPATARVIKAGAAATHRCNLKCHLPGHCPESSGPLRSVALSRPRPIPTDLEGLI
jgi:hypothetical protein